MNIIKIFCLISAFFFFSNIIAQSTDIHINTTEVFELDSNSYYGELEVDSLEMTADEMFPYDSSAIIPCFNLYHLWEHTLVNPYKIDLTLKTDTTFIDCKGFCPPIVNKINSDFGLRRWRYHYGVDIDLEKGDSIRSSFDGMVRMATRGKRFGYYIVVRHFNGLETVYGHLSKLLVLPNQNVKAGDVIALGGNTGRSTGPHLHFEFRYLGQPINPHDLVDFSTYNLKSETFALSKGNFDYVVEMRKIKYHKVHRGETLSHISMHYGVPVKKLRQLNKISRSNIIRAGQMIRYN